ncbi:MAG: prepilin-type N-terminal cleavage/methylation domain-containing protein [Planctomycetota bacterium]
MTDAVRQSDCARRGGFTLVEMLAALVILAFGITAILGVFSGGIRTEQSSELIRQASLLAERIQEELANEDRLGKPSEALPGPVRNRTHRDYPNLVYDLDYYSDGQASDRLIVRVTVHWLRRGEGMAEVYSFRMPRERPLSARIRDERQR